MQRCLRGLLLERSPHAKLNLRRTALGAAIVAHIYLIMPQGMASTSDQFGLGAAGLSLGNAAIATPDPAYAAFYNPAAIPQGEKTLGSFSMTNIDWRLQDLNPGYRNQGATLAVETYQASEAESSEGLGFGFKTTIPFGLHVGLSGFMPKEILSVHGNSGEEVSYLKYQDRSKKPEIYLAVARELPLGFSLGLGSYMSLKAKGTFQAGFTDEESRGRLSLETKPVSVPYGGVRWAQVWGQAEVAFGFFYRQSHTTDVGLETQLVGKTDGLFLVPTDVDANLAAFHDPELRRYGVSVAYEQLMVHIAMEESRWGDYKSPTMQIASDDFALADEDDFGGQAPTLRNTQAYKAGLSYDSNIANWDASFRFGYEVHPSAIENKASSPVVDLGRRSVSLGVGVDLSDGDESSLVEGTMIDVGYHYSWLDEETLSSEGGQSYKAGGAVSVLSGGLSHAF